MKLVVVSPFWNCPNLVTECIQSLKNQYYTNFLAYFIDDMSTDDSYERALETIGDDERFVLVKNNKKKYKTKNFIDIIKNNDKIEWDDVIIELDGDDRLIDNFVLGRLNKIYSDINIWICGTKFKDNYGNIGKYTKPNLVMPRKNVWNFSHMRTYRAFLFRAIKDEDLKFEGDYFKAACDIGFGMPMLEMSGPEHFYYIDEPLYLYNWHNKQSYSEESPFKDKKLQSRTSDYIYHKLQPYGRLTINYINESNEDDIEIVMKRDNTEILNKIFGGQIPTRPKIEIDYSNIKVNKKIYISPQRNPEIKQTPPNDRNKLVEMKKDSLSQLARDISGIKPNRKKNLPNIFSKKG